MLQGLWSPFPNTISCFSRLSIETVKFLAQMGGRGGGSSSLTVSLNEELSKKIANLGETYFYQ